MVGKRNVYRTKRSRWSVRDELGQLFERVIGFVGFGKRTHRYGQVSVDGLDRWCVLRSLRFRN
jgi:hypothetical protein